MPHHGTQASGLFHGLSGSGLPPSSYFPLIAASMLMWFSSRIEPVARCNAAFAFTYELWAATSVELGLRQQALVLNHEETVEAPTSNLACSASSDSCCKRRASRRPRSWRASGAWRSTRLPLPAAPGSAAAPRGSATASPAVRRAPGRLPRSGCGWAASPGADAIGRVIAREKLAQYAAVAADEARVESWPETRSGLAGEAVVLHRCRPDLLPAW